VIIISDFILSKSAYRSASVMTLCLARGRFEISKWLSGRSESLRNRGRWLIFLLAAGSQLMQVVSTEAAAENVLGMSAALTGSAGELGKDMQRGILAGLERANRTGGVNGRSLRLIALDDCYEPARTDPNVRQLIEKDNVLALIGNVG